MLFYIPLEFGGLAVLTGSAISFGLGFIPWATSGRKLQGLPHLVAILFGFAMIVVGAGVESLVNHQFGLTLVCP